MAMLKQISCYTLYETLLECKHFDAMDPCCGGGIWLASSAHFVFLGQKLSDNMCIHQYNEMTQGKKVHEFKKNYNLSNNYKNWTNIYRMYK